MDSTVFTAAASAASATGSFSLGLKFDFTMTTSFVVLGVFMPSTKGFGFLTTLVFFAAARIRKLWHVNRSSFLIGIVRLILPLKLAREMIAGKCGLSVFLHCLWEQRFSCY